MPLSRYYSFLEHYILHCYLVHQIVANFDESWFKIAEFVAGVTGDDCLNGPI